MEEKPDLRSLPDFGVFIFKKTLNFYRDMEEVVLKHNCIAYLLQDFGVLGNDQLIDAKNLIMKDFKVIFGENLDNYAALTKFMEQAFEWNIMSYTFYPYYWGSKQFWKCIKINELKKNILNSQTKNAAISCSVSLSIIY